MWSISPAACGKSESCKSRVSSFQSRFQDERSRKPEGWEKHIKKKLQKCNKLREDVSDDEQKQTIDMFGNADNLLRNHLIWEKYSTDQFRKKLDVEFQDFSLAESLNEQEEERIIERILEFLWKPHEIHIGLFFTLLEQPGTDYTVVRMAAANLFTYGLVHVGLLIGGVPVHWNSDSIVNFDEDPKRCVAYVRVFEGRIMDEQQIRAKMEELEKASSNDKSKRSQQRIRKYYDIVCEELLTHETRARDKLEKVAQRCEFYNRMRDYNLTSCNCQTFVQDILKYLDIAFEPKDEFKLFMDRIRTSHSDRDIFKYKEIIFESRETFDNYVYQNWASEKSDWNKRLLIQYSDLMNYMYLRSERTDQTWGPMDANLWEARSSSLFK